MSASLEITGLVAGYGRTEVLHDVTLSVRAGEIVALIGANGAGKSTLLNTVMGLVPVAAGDIRLDGKSVRRQSTAAIVREGLVQVPERRQLFGGMTVEENLRMGAFAIKDRGSIPALMDRQFDQFPILRERRRQFASTLSGGEQQMVAIARAMMAAPRLMLLDEPSLGLAPLFVTRIFEQIKALRAGRGTILLVEHDMRLVMGLADTVVVMHHGQKIAAGPPDRVRADREVIAAYLGTEIDERVA